jgi:hypothetical protein
MPVARDLGSRSCLFCTGELRSEEMSYGFREYSTRQFL